MKKIKCMKQKFLCSILIVVLYFSFPFGNGRGWAQDPHLSQYYAFPLALNPASTGMYDNADWKAHLQHRNQWGNLIAKPFVTDAVSFDMPWQKYGFGAYILSNRAGTSNFNALNFVLSSAYEITIDPNRIHHLTTGLQLGFIQKSVNMNNVSFDNQYNSATGEFDLSADSRENFSKQGFFMPEANLGIQYNYTNPSNKFSPYIGASGFHLTQPKETFLGRENKLPARIVVSGGSKYEINNEFSAEGNFMFQRQKNNNELQFGAIGIYNYEEKKMKFFLGPYYRNKDAVVIHTGMEYGEYTFRMSYDYNVSPLSAIMGRSAGFEFSVTYTKKRVSYVPSIL